MSANEELRRIFKEEATEFVEALTALVAGLSRSTGAEFESTLKDALRTAHNLKGAATSTGFGVVESLAHAFEGVLAQYREEKGPLPADVVPLGNEALGLIQDAVDETAPEDRVSEMLERLASMGVALIAKETVRPATQRDTEVRQSRPSNTPNVGTNGKESAVRVNTSRLDNLMGFIGDFLTFKTRLGVQHARQDAVYKALQAVHKSHPELHDRLSPIIGELRRLSREGRKDLLDFSNLTDSMSDATKQLRMVPLRGASSMWRRIVREACNICGKEVQVDVNVGRVEIDRFVLERISDPVMHILRNAVDHGIEPRDERIRLGKPEVGQIRVSAEIQGAMVQLSIDDDGRGIDFAKIRHQAVDAGLVSPETVDTLENTQIADFLFRTGFSMAKTTTRISGRGVGLDVVRVQTEALGGNVVLKPSGVLGGTAVVLSVPVSILSTEGLFVRVKNSHYALPIESVSRTLRVQRSDLRTADGKCVITPEGEEPISVVELAAQMGEKSAAQKSAAQSVVNIVVLSRGASEIGLVVDQVLGLREYVIHGLPWNFNRFPGINGAILEADGSVVLLVDVLSLFEAEHQGDASALIRRSSRRKSVLLVDDSLSSRTLQRSMLTADGYDVTTASDGEEAWLLLSKNLYDLVVSDIQMPKMDGFELTQRIRETPRTADLPVILVTSLSNPEDRAKGSAVGADDYLVKGTFDQAALLRIVGRYLGGQ